MLSSLARFTQRLKGNWVGVPFGVQQGGWARTFSDGTGQSFARKIVLYWRFFVQDFLKFRSLVSLCMETIELRCWLPWTPWYPRSSFCCFAVRSSWRVCWNRAWDHPGAVRDRLPVTDTSPSASSTKGAAHPPAPVAAPLGLLPGGPLPGRPLPVSSVGFHLRISQASGRSGPRA